MSGWTDPKNWAMLGAGLVGIMWAGELVSAAKPLNAESFAASGSTKTMKEKDAINALTTAQGKFMTVNFLKKDGTSRRMRCRTGVKRYVKGVGSPLGTAANRLQKYKLITVYDLDKAGYRSIPVDRVVSVKAGGKTYNAKNPKGKQMSAEEYNSYNAEWEAIFDVYGRRGYFADLPDSVTDGLTEGEIEELIMEESEHPEWEEVDEMMLQGIEKHNAETFNSDTWRSNSKKLAYMSSKVHEKYPEIPENIIFDYAEGTWPADWDEAAQELIDELGATNWVNQAAESWDQLSDEEIFEKNNKLIDDYYEVLSKSWTIIDGEDIADNPSGDNIRYGPDYIINDRFLLRRKPANQIPHDRRAAEGEKEVCEDSHLDGIDFLEWTLYAEGPNCYITGLPNPSGDIEGHDNICEPCAAKWIYDEGGPEGEGYYRASVHFEAPYAGAGALMDIGKDTGLGSFSPSELATSSAIHGDFDQASLNYSGKQNLEVRAESDRDEDEEDYEQYLRLQGLCECTACGDIAEVSMGTTDKQGLYRCVTCVEVARPSITEEELVEDMDYLRGVY
tara:strand:- start:657 stop:2336 length:1680 start_codon:yes stop_codon:yes gene_type:complete